MKEGHTELRPAVSPGWFERLRHALGRGRPWARVTASSSARLGEPLDVEWQLEQAPSATLVTVSLVGSEIARRRVSARTGITIIPERQDFCVVELDRRVPQRGSARGEGAAVVPQGLVPSFAAKFNEVAWSVVVDVAADEAPGSRHEFPLTMLPVRA
jgi:hypothetical protein